MKLKTKPKKKHAKQCPGCGLLIIFDPAACKIRHPNPICGTFEAVARASGMKPEKEPWAFVVAPDGSVKEPGSA